MSPIIKQYPLFESRLPPLGLYLVGSFELPWFSESPSRKVDFDCDTRSANQLTWASSNLADRVTSCGHLRNARRGAVVSRVGQYVMHIRQTRETQREGGSGPSKVSAALRR